MSDLNKRTLTLDRIFNAPIEVVWEAWTKPEHIAQWWGPGGMEITIIEHNFFNGGSWKYSMLMPDGSEFLSEGVYKEIVKHKKIISLADFKPMTEGVEIQAYFEADGDKTKFKFSVIHANEEYCRQQEQMGFMNGWGSVFDRLGQFVQK